MACKKLAIRCKRFEDGKKAGVGRLETVLVVLGRFAMVMDGIGAQVRGRVIWDRLVLRTRLM